MTSATHSASGHRPQVQLVRAPLTPEPTQLTDEQLAVLDATAGQPGATCVVGGPGTGKTTTLVAIVLDLVQRRAVPISSIVVLTGSRPAAQRLRARLLAGLGTTQRRVQVMTVHAWCQQLLHRFAGPEQPAPRLLSAPEQEYRVRELLEGVPDGRWPDDLSAALGTRGFAREVRTALATARQQGLDPEDLAELAGETGRAELGGLAEFFGDYLDVLDAEGVIDYAELVHRARLLLLEPDVREQLTQFAGHVLCDEFAELDRGMINLLADLAAAGSNVTAFADPDTSVFGFRGADPRAVGEFVGRFSAPGRPARLLQLTNNLRNEPAIAQVMARVAAKLPHLGVAHPPAQSLEVGDRVSVRLSPDATSQANRIAESLRLAHLQDGYDWSQMAVITRSGHNAVATLARRLAAAGVPVQVAGDEVALADELAVRHLLATLTAAVTLAEGGVLSEQQAARLLRSPLAGLDALGLRRLGRELRALALAQAPDQAIAPGARLIADELTAAHLVAGDPEPDASSVLQALAGLRKLLGDLAGQVRDRVELPTLLWQAWSGTNWPARLRAEALGGSADSARAHRDLDAVVALFDVAGREVGWAGAKGVRSLIAEVESQQIPADTARESDPQRRGVQVLTVHRAKGQAWPVVAVTGLQEGAWPVLGGRTAMLSVERPDEATASPARDHAGRIADERRALLLAVSRASERLLVSAIDDPAGEVSAPSRFIAELGVPIDAATEEQLPSTLFGLVALLRRTACDPQTSPELRAAAAAELAWLTDQTDDSGRSLAPGADPATWWGLREISAGTRPVVGIGEPIRLSGSQVQGLLSCPRRWFLGSRAQGQPANGPAATMGTLVHALIAQSATSGVPAGVLAAQLDELWPAMPYQADWLRAAERERADETLHRYDAWASAAEHQRVLGVEVGFEMPITIDDRQLVLVGTVDRLELDSHNRLRIVDFKTGKQAATAQQAAQMDQLGIYQLAARLGAFDSLSGGVRELADPEIVYLRVGAGQAAVRTQHSLDDRPLLEPGESAADGRTWVHDRLSVAAEIIHGERFDAIASEECKRCPFRLGCPAQAIGKEA